MIISGKDISVPAQSLIEATRRAYIDGQWCNVTILRDGVGSRSGPRIDEQGRLL